MGGPQNRGYANVSEVQGVVDWIYPLPSDSFVTSGMSLAPDGTLFAFVKGGQLLAIDSALGTLKWSLDVPFLSTSLWPQSTPLVSKNGSIYFGSTDGTFYCVNAANGSIHWTKAVGSPVRGSPTMTSDGRVIINGQNGEVVCYNGDTGDVIWSVPAININVNSDNSPVLSADEKTVFIPGFPLRAIDTQTGNVKWSVNTKSDTVNEMSSDGAGTLFVCEYTGFEAFSEATGTRLWQGSLPYVSTSAPLVSPTGQVFYTVGAGPGQDPNIYAYNAATGSLAWAVTTNSLSSNGAILGGSIVYSPELWNGRIVKYDAATGANLGQIAWPNSTAGMFADSMMFDANGALIAGGNGAIIKYH